MAFCANCGEYVRDEELKLRTKQERQQMGAVSWSRVKSEYLCQKCAAESDVTEKFLVGCFWVFISIGAVVALLTFLIRGSLW